MAAAKGNDYTLKRKWRPQYTQAQLEILAEELLDHAQNSKSIHLASWCRAKGFGITWLCELAKTHEIIATAYVQAKELLSEKVLNASFFGGANATVGLAYLPVYDLEYKSMLKWKSALPAEAQAENTLSTLSQLKSMAMDGSLLKLLSQGQDEPKKGS
jgi:hypothetical protein